MDSAIWTEKYRPKDFPEIKGQEEIVKRVKAFVEKRNIPHLLFAGPAGVGKTTLALTIARQLFKDSWHQNFLELNASDERGIDIIRNKVKDFARTRAIGDFPFKVIYLDECMDYNSSIIIKSLKGEIETVKIGNFVENFSPEDYKVLSINDCGQKIFVRINSALKLSHKEEEGFYKLTVHNKTIKLTGNHLLISLEGWKPVRDLKAGDLILSALPSSEITGLSGEDCMKDGLGYELVGLPREIRKKERYIANSPEKQIIELLGDNPALSRKDITKISGIRTSKISSILGQRKNRFYLSLLSYRLIKKEDGKFKLAEEKNKALNHLYKLKREQNSKNQKYVQDKLASLGLFPLPREKAIAAARILGHLFGDGSLSLKSKQLFFSGKEEDLKTIKDDLNLLGFYSLGNVRYNRWRNGECWSFGAYNLALLSLFYSLGAPVGKKTDTYYEVPQWIVYGALEIKRAFLASFFGSEGDKPKFQGRTIKPIRIAQSKRLDLKYNLLEFLNQISTLLSDFGINTRVKIKGEIKTIRKDGTKAIGGYIWVTNSSQNIANFLSRIGYCYCSYKVVLAKKILYYLSWKASLGDKIYSFRPIPHFDKWIAGNFIGECAYSYITHIEKIADPEYVYCLATENQKFIADGILVHNCDALTREAQQALRRTMENYTQTCRFILSANYSSKIIDPIQSRCAMFRFKPLEKKDIFDIIGNIEKSEGMKVEEKAKEALYNISEGDARRINNVLQSCAAMSNKVTEELVYSMASMARPKEIDEVLKLALQNKFIDARKKLLDVMLSYGLSGVDVIKQIQQEILNLDIENDKKMLLMEKCGEIEFRMTEGSDEFIQLEALLSQFCLYGNKK